MDVARSNSGGLAGQPRRCTAWVILILGVLAFASLGGVTADAETITWTNTSGGSWGTASNWNPQDVPNEAGEEAVIPAAQGTYAISLNTSYSLDRVYLNNEAATLQLATRSLTLSQPEGLVNYGTILGGGSFHGYLDQVATGRLSVPAGTSIYLYGSARNAGLIDIGANPVTGQSRIYIATADYPIDGPGQIVLHGESDPNMARLDGYYGNLIQGSEHTIRGAGTINVDLNSAGQVIADQNGYTLLLNGSAKANSGLLEATHGGVLELASITLTQAGPAQLLADGGRVRVNASTVNGGTLNTMNGGVIETAGNAGLTDVTSLGELRVPGGSWTYLRGAGTTNEGTIGINPDGSGTDGGVYVAAYNHLLQGDGEIVLRTAGDPNDARITHSYGTLIQAAGHTIRGAGRILVGLTNEGLVQADVPGQTLLLDDQVKTNNATYQAIDGGILRLERETTQGPSGRILADGGTVEIACNITGGRIESAPGSVVYWHDAPVLTDIHNLSDARVPGGVTPRFSGAGTTNDGTILLNADSVAADAILYIQNSYDHQLQGSGEIVLQSAGAPEDARIASSYGSLVQGAAHTIRGAGRVTVQLTNQGLVDADVPGQVLVLDSETKTNNAIFRATEGGILRLGRETTQGAEGRILADGGTVEIACNINGGRIESAPGSVVYWQDNSVLSDVHNLGEMLVPGGNTPRFSGAGTTNDGTILVNSDSTATDAVVYVQNSSGHQLQGNGEIVLQSAGSYDDARLVSYYGSLVQGAAHTIRGAGRIQVGLTNNGTLNADVRRQLLVLDTEAKTNNALFAATGGGILRLSTSTTQGPEGRLVAADSGVVELRHTVNGGRIECDPDGQVYWLASSDLHDIHTLGRIEVPGGNTPSLRGTATTNDGTILVNSDSVAADAIVYITNSANHLLQGSGEIVLRASSDANDARVTGYYGSLIQGASHTIRGAGRIQVALDNQGTVKADVPSQTLLVDTEAKTSSGTMRAENGGILNVGVAFANAGLADAWSGGTFRTGVAPSNYSSGTLTGGRWEVHDHSTLRLLSTNIQRLNARVLLDGPNANLYRDDGTTPGLGSLNAIEDYGDFELAGGRSFTTAGNLSVNAGRLTIGAGSTLTVNGQYTQSGNGEPGLDVSTVNGVLVATAGPVVIGGGRLIGTGTVQNDVQSSGWVGPGASVGELTIAGSYAQSESGTCHIELAGPNAGQHDHLRVAGAATLAGRLIVQAVDGYLPPVGTSFTIMDFASRTGTFTLETGSPGSGLEYTTQYYDDRVVITITSAPSSVPDGEEIADASEEEPVEPEMPAEVLPATVAFSAHPQTGGAAAIELALPWDAIVEVSLFDLTGRRIALLRQGPESAGTHSYRWDGGSRCASGVYLARVRVNGAGKMLERCVRTLLIR